MFRFVKPAHVQMRAALPALIMSQFDAVFSAVDAALPSFPDRGARERALGIVMGYWIEDCVSAGDFFLSGLTRQKVAHLHELCERYNERDFHGDGHAASIAALHLVGALREARAGIDEITSADYINAFDESVPAHASEPEADLESRKRSLDERLRKARER